MASRKIRLTEEQITIVMSMPETGMGYHLVTLGMKDGRRLRDRVVLNSELLVLNADEIIKPEEIAEISAGTPQAES